MNYPVLLELLILTISYADYCMKQHFTTLDLRQNDKKMKVLHILDIRVN